MERRTTAIVGILLLLGACTAERRDTQPEGTRRPSRYTDTWNLGVGERGPGGGTVYYVAEEPFACGEDLETWCRYLEVSPVDAETSLPWAGPGNHAVTVPGTAGHSIGEGRRNSRDVARHERDLPGNSAAVYAASYENDGYDDWYLPSLGELNELCKYANNQQTGDPTVGCDGDDNLRNGFAADDYWSSTQLDDRRAFLIDIHLGGAGSIYKPSRYRVRPIRAF